MAPRIQGAFSNCCDTVKNYGAKTAQWMGKTLTSAKDSIVAGAQKVQQTAAPYIAQIKQFAQENKTALVIGAIGIAIGAALAMLVARLFCKGDQAAQATTPAPVANTPAVPANAAAPAA